MTMMVLHGDRQSGRTTQCCIWAHDNPDRVIVVATIQEKMFILNTYGPGAKDVDKRLVSHWQVVTINEYMKKAGWSVSTQFMFDNIEHILQHLTPRTGGRIAGFTCDDSEFIDVRKFRQQE